ncbi:helix-turn-helix domain-containing protein [Pelobium sp.]|nr:helix-turn-helix domain-containing protein [Pelobium sp.]MDA9555150.1 helix-turn-helix domain-containing protein [Pelobium sp.]
MNQDIGAKIRKVRTEKNIKQEELAHFLSIKQSTLSKMENGNCFISFEQIINIAYYTKTLIHDFFPDNLTHLQQINFRMELQDLQNDLRYHKELNIQLLKRIQNLERQLTENGVIISQNLNSTK